MKTFEIFVVLSICVTLTCAGHKSSGSGGHDIQIKGGIGDGYIYPAKSKHHSGGAGGGGGAASGAAVQTYKFIIQNAAAQPAESHVKTFKVITQNHATASHTAPVKTLKLIHVKGASGDCSSNGHGWQ